ncbi:MAG: hypothetical protein LC789_09470, partial [Actinobacteria bacterium]|nr:hypothetical protein [Actinomycetota bacterium]
APPPVRRLWVFNPPHTSFATYPPTFGRVRHYTNASTVAIAWDLMWEQAPAGCAAEQADPEHHLALYRVLRRALDTDERDVVRHVKSADVLHRTPGADGDALTTLRPRFQVVDHFTAETPAEQAGLPATGRSYLYTITPVDNAGQPGRPLTLVATRFPDRPPRVPTDARLRVRYRLADAELDDDAPVRLNVPDLLAPAGVSVEWTEPPLGRGESRVPVKGYRLIFRRTAALPVGSYGLDSTTQRPAATLIGSAVARPLPTDLVVDVPDVDADGEQREATVDLAELRRVGVLPGAPDPRWRPDAWDVFVQAIAINDVPSSLAPAQIVLEVGRAGAVEVASVERQPAELEWLPAPMDLPLLPPRDQRAVVRDAHFPMPVLRRADDDEWSAAFEGSDTQVAYQRHPAGIRCVQVCWNQGRSGLADYPLDLTAGYLLLELDVDAATTDTFRAGRRIAESLRTLQEVRIVPAEDLPFLPGGTLEPSQWEAWYPSTMQRRVADPGQRAPGSQIPSTPWYSWRESVLEWPRPDVAGAPAWRSGDLHPMLGWIVDRLDGVLFHAPAGAAEFAALDAGVVPPQLPFTADHVPLTPTATVRVVSAGFEWRIEDEANLTELYQVDGQVVYARLLRVVRSDTGVIVSVAGPFAVDRQELVPAQQAGFVDYLDATPAKGDPYGWGVLQSFGLSTTLALRHVGTGEPVLGEGLLDAIQATVSACFALDRFAEFRPHLFVELLFQPGRSVELDGTPAEATGLLANVQLSLRPAIRQRQAYATLGLVAEPASVVAVAFALADGQTLDIINRDERAAGMQPVSGVSGVGTLDVAVPLSGVAQLSLRTGFGPTTPDGPPVLPRVGFATGSAAVALSGELAERFETRQIGTTSYVFLRPGMPADADARRALFDLLAAALQAEDVALPFTDLTDPRVFAPTAEPSTDFTAPQDALATAFAGGQGLAGQQWDRFARYVDSIFTSAPTRIVTPRSQGEVQQVLPAFLSWSHRFFDAAGTVGFGPGDTVGRYGTGAWLATAYPRAGTPASATPDESGRLTYTHLLRDRWAHAYRYYLKPYSRYARLMAALRDALAPVDAPATSPPVVEPDPADGGLDVVVERTEPVAAPLVLFSGRLDGVGAPDAPLPPGPTWEVLVAQHPEQALSERNQTVRRRLSFRQVAFTLLRRFADTSWLVSLEAHHGRIGVDPPVYRYVENITQPIPTAYPPRPDHLDLPALRGPGPDADKATQVGRDAARHSLDLPLRLGRFQQGALVLQWDGLPHYYEHRLLLIAQTDTTVSPVTELTQRDFEYRSPLPAADAAGAVAAWPADAPFQPPVPPEVRGRRATVALRRFWDGLPAAAQARWSSEDPGDAPYGADRPFASLPDNQVVYQVVERFGGNVEVQAEMFFRPSSDDPAAEWVPQRRQLGRRVLVGPPEFTASAAGGDYALVVPLVQFHELPLSPACPPLPARSSTGCAPRVWSTPPPRTSSPSCGAAQCSTSTGRPSWPSTATTSSEPHWPGSWAAPRRRRTSSSSPNRLASHRSRCRPAPPNSSVSAPDRTG